MSNTLYLSIEGLEALEWMSAFELEVKKLLHSVNFEVFIPKTIGGAGGGKKNQIGIRDNINSIASVMTIIQIAISLASPTPIEKTEFECNIEGNKGSVSIKINGDQKVHAEIIESCLKKIGNPGRIHLSPVGGHKPKSSKKCTNLS